MKLVKREVLGVVVVEVHGQLVGGPYSLDEFHALIQSMLDAGKNKIVISLRHAPWASSQGIGMLLGAFASARKAGGELVLAHLADRTREVLIVTKLLLVFKAFDREEEAVKYLAGNDEGIDEGQNLAAGSRSAARRSTPSHSAVTPEPRTA